MSLKQKCIWAPNQYEWIGIGAPEMKMIGAKPDFGEQCERLVRIICEHESVLDVAYRAKHLEVRCQTSTR